MLDLDAEKCCTTCARDIRPVEKGPSHILNVAVL